MKKKKKMKNKQKKPRRITKSPDLTKTTNKKGVERLLQAVNTERM